MGRINVYLGMKSGKTNGEHKIATRNVILKECMIISVVLCVPFVFPPSFSAIQLRDKHNDFLCY